MKDSNKREFDSLVRAKQYGEDHPPGNALAAAGFTALGGSIAAVVAIEADRLNGTGTFRGATGERQWLRKQLRDGVSELSRISKILDKAAYPDVAAQLKMGGARTYTALLTFAKNAITVVEPIKQAFIDRGAAATVIEDLQGTINALAAAVGRSYSGRGRQINKNVAVRMAIRAGREQVRILDGILSSVLKGSPGLLAEWKAAKRVQRAPRRRQTEPVPGEPTQPVSA